MPVRISKNRVALENIPLNEALSTVASATTPDIWAAAIGNVINYTGTATATGFAAAPQAGARRTLVCAGAAVFTAGANMLIDGIASGSNFTAAAGDKVHIIAVTTTQFRLTPAKADGTAVVTVSGGVTSVTGTAPIASSGGTTPAISLNDAGVSQSKIKTTTAEYSVTTAPGPDSTSLVIILAGGPYSFSGSEGKTAGVCAAAQHEDYRGGANETTYESRALLAVQAGDCSGGPTATGYFRYRYIQSSPPWEPYLADDPVPLFIFALLDKTTGKVIATSTAEDPPWGNNGPTILNPRGRLQRLARARLPFMWDVAKGDRAKRALYEAELTKLRRFMADKANAPAIAAEMAREFTQAEKNADMPLIPHPFASFDPAKHVVVIINPTDDDFCGNMHCRHTLLGDSVAEALHGDYLQIDNSPMPGLVTPASVMAVRARWKLT